MRAKLILLSLFVAGLCHAQPQMPYTAWTWLFMTNSTAASARSYMGITSLGDLAVVDDIAALQAYADTATSVIVSDTNRGGLFTYTTDALTADGGVVFAATGVGSGFWQRQFDGPVVADWWGIVPNSSAAAVANVASLQAALDYADSYTRGRTVTMRAAGGVYLDLGITIPSSVIFDANNVLLYIGNYSARPSSRGVAAFDLESQAQIRDATIYSLEPDCTVVSTGKGMGTWTVYPVIRDCYLYGTFRIGLDIEESSTLIDNVYANGNVSYRFNYTSACKAQSIIAQPNTNLTASIITGVMRTNALACFSTSSAHDLVPGQPVNIVLATNTSFNASGYVYSAPATNVFTILSAGIDVTNAVDQGFVTDTGSFTELLCGIVANDCYGLNLRTPNVEDSSTDQDLSDAIVLNGYDGDVSNWWIESATNNIVALNGNWQIGNGNVFNRSKVVNKQGARLFGDLVVTNSSGILAQAAHIWLFNEGVGQIVADQIGSAHLYITNATSYGWTNDLNGTVLRVSKNNTRTTTTQTEKVATTIDGTKDWSLLYLVKANAGDTHYVNIPADFISTVTGGYIPSINMANQMQVKRSRGAASQSYITTVDQYTSTWAWLGVSYSATDQTLTLLHKNVIPVYSSTVSWTRPATNCLTDVTTALRFHRWDYNTYAVSDFSAEYGFMALWQKAITRTDVDWIANNISAIRSVAKAQFPSLLVMPVLLAAPSLSASQAALYSALDGSSKAQLYTVNSDGYVNQLSGNMGIGTNAPTAQLVVLSQGAEPAIVLENDAISAGTYTNILGGTRGPGAVDLQYGRNVSTKIASGTNSFIGGGTNNTASAFASSVAGGSGNVASGPYAFAAGRSVTASGQSSVAIGYNNSTASDYSIAIGDNNVAASPSIIVGSYCTSYGDFALSTGLRSSSTRYGQFARASGYFTTAGDAQMSILTARNTTSGATPAALYLDGASATITLPANTSWAFRAEVVGRTTDAGTGDEESGAYTITGLIERDNAAANTRIVGSVTTTVIAEDDAAWDATATADTTNGALTITVTGNNETTIRWVATVYLTQVGG